LPLLASMLLLGGANSMLFAIVPPAARQLGLVEWQIGLIVTLSAAAYMVSAAMWGRVSDLKGRRPVVVLGMAGFGIGGIVFAAVLDAGLSNLMPPMLALVLMILVRVLQSIASSGAFPATQAHIAENAEPARRAVALSSVTSAFALGSVLGPAIAGALVAIWLTLPLYLIAALSLGVAAWVAFAMAPSIHVGTRTATRLSPRDPRVAPWIAVGAIYFVSVSGTQQVLGFALQDRLVLTGSSAAAMTSWMFMLTGTVAVLFQLLGVRNSGWSASTLMQIGLTGAAVAQAGLVIADRPWHFLLVAVPLGISFSCVAPGFTASVSLAVGANEQGGGAGLVAAAQAAGFLVGPLLFSVLYQAGSLLPFLLALVIAVGVLRLVRVRR